MLRTTRHELLRPFVLIGALMLCSQGCAALHAALDPTSGFLSYEDRRVRYEPGAEALARQTADALPGAIATVEQSLGSPFPDPVEIYVAASEQRYAELANAPEDTRGAVTRKLFISPRVLRPAFTGTLPAVLSHELSHLHLQQHLGYQGRRGRLPAWFDEGLAEAVSGGCGGSTVSVTAATEAIANGVKLKPNDSGSVFRYQDERTYGLERGMFYRQSGMFVEFLRDRDRQVFSMFLKRIEAGGTFAREFRQSFGMTVEDAWGKFEKPIKTL